jgi:DegV family protein with EDD domain
MTRTAIVTDSNSGIFQDEAGARGIYVVPMPFYVGGKLYYEGVTMTWDEFFEHLKNGEDISTSTPARGDVTDLWDKLLKDYENIVYIPMSSGLSSSCSMAILAAQDDKYEGRVFVVNNQRISVTQRQSVLDAKEMADRGFGGARIRQILEDTKFDSSIYIMVDTLKYLKKGGRITPAAAALGTLLRLKPVLQIQGEKLDAYAKCRTVKQAKTTMLEAVDKDMKERFRLGDHPEDAVIAGAYTAGQETVHEWIKEVNTAYPNHDIVIQPLPLSISCHIGPGSLAVTISKKLVIPEE